MNSATSTEPGSRWWQSQASRAAGWAAVALVGGVGNAVRGSTGWLALVNPIQATSLFAALVFLLAGRPRARELSLFLIGSVGFVPLHRAWLHLFHFRGVPFEQSLLVAAGLASLLALGVRAATSERDSEAQVWFRLASILPAFGMAFGLCLDLTVAVYPRAWDPVVLALDASFGQPSFVVGRVAAAHPALLTLLSLVYLLLPVAMAMIIVLERRRPTAGRPAGALTAFLLAAVVGFVLYGVYPVIGPGSLFGDGFPFGTSSLPGPPHRMVEVANLPDARNCMPSLHATWALLIYWRARRLGLAARLGAAAWLALTVLATLGVGQHYFVDLVVAVPFAALIDALSDAGAPGQSTRVRLGPIATAAAPLVVLLTVWYAILLSAPPVPVHGGAVVLFSLVTIAASWTLQARR